MDYLYYVAICLAFVAVVMFLEGAYGAWNSSQGPEAKRIRARLAAMSNGVASNGSGSLMKDRKLSETQWISAILAQLPGIKDLDRTLVQSGLGWTVGRFVAYVGAMTLIGLVTSALVLRLNPLAVLLCTVGLGVLPLIKVMSERSKRLEKIDHQLPDALELMSRAMRAGHAFPSGIQMVGQEAAPPIANEFKTVFDEINYGIPLTNALKNLALRVPSSDLRYFVVAVSIQRETGGDLAEVLDKIAALIRSRLELLGKVRVLSAEGRLSAWILSLLPFVLAAVLSAINPNFLKQLWTDPMGLRLVAGAAVLMALGVFWLWRITKIRV